MSKKAIKGMGIPLMILSFFFYFNPDFAAFDILPDLIGHAIMYLALSRLSDTNYHFDDARRKFKYGIYAGLGEILFILFIFGIAGIAERSVYILMFTFIFGFADILIFVSAFKDLLEGFTSLGTLCDGEAMFNDSKQKGNYSDRVSRMTFIFILVRSLCTCLPELTSLIDNAEYRFIGLLRGFAIMVSLVIGIIWLVYVIKYISHVRKDTVFISNIEAKHAELLRTRPNMFLRRKLIFGMGAISTGLIFSIDFYSDYYNVIPDFIPALIILFGTISLSKYSKKWKPTAILSIVYAIISTVHWILSIRFFDEYYPQAALKNIDAYYKYNTMLFTGIACEICFIVLLVLCIAFVGDICKTHAAPENKTELTDEDWFYTDLKRNNTVLFIISIVCSAVNIYYTLTLTSYSNSWYISMASIFTLFADIAFCAYAFKYFGDIKEEIKFRYRNA